MISSLSRHTGLRWLLLASVLLSACATQEFTPTNPAALQEAARAALSQSVHVETLTSRCSRLNDELALQAEELYQDWLDANWTMVAAADKYFSTELADPVHSYLGQTLSLDAVYLSHSTQRRTLAQLDLERRTATNQRITCTRELQRLRQFGMSVITESKHAPYLYYITEQYSAQAERTITPVPSLAGSIPLDLPPGRSFYALEEQTRHECPGAEIIVLHNQWPQEAYAAYCETLPLTFVTCEWGNCDQVEM